MRRPCYLRPHHRTTWAAAPPCPRLTRRGRSSRRRGAGRGRPPPRPEHSLRHGTGSGTPLDCPRRTSSITRCVPAGLAPTWSKTRHRKAVPHPLVMHQILLHPARAKLVTLSANWRGFSDAQWRPPLPRTRGGGSDALRVRKAIPIRLPGLATLTPVDPPGSIRAVSPSGAVPMPTAPLTLSCQ